MENQLAANAAPTIGDPFAQAKQPPDSLPLIEADFFTAILNWGKSKQSLDRVERERLSPTGQLLFDGCNALKGNGVIFSPESLSAQLRRLADDSAGHSEASAFKDAANFVENHLSEVPRDRRLLNAATAETLADQINGDGFADGKTGAVPQRKAFSLLSIPQLFAKPDPDFLINQILVAGSVALFTAKEESYKSFIATDMALCVATGKPYHGLVVNRPGTVIYVAAEGASGLKRRVQAWLQDRAEKDIGADRFLVLDEPLQIGNATERAAFIAHLSDLKPALIIFDTLRRCAVGLDENSAADMGVFTDALGDVAAKTGACVLAIHHNNKSGEYSGSTALAGNVDTRLTCKRHTDDLVTLTIEKQKDFEKHGPISFEKRVVPIHGTQGQASSLVFNRVAHRRDDPNALSATDRRLLEILSTLGEQGATNAEWQDAAEKAGVPKSTFMAAVKRLRDVTKAVQIVSGTEGQRGARYGVAPVGTESDAED